MHYFQNPMVTTTQKVSAGMAKALSYFTQLRLGLKQYTTDEKLVFQTELKKLCLAVEAAEDVRVRQQAAGQEPDPQAIFIKEVQNQIQAFALMRMAKPEKVAQAVTIAYQQYSQLKGPGPSRAELLVKQLHTSLGAVDQEQFHTGIGIQPLTMLLVHKREMMEKFGELFPHAIDHCFKTLHETNRTIEQLSTLGGP